MILNLSTGTSFIMMFHVLSVHWHARTWVPVGSCLRFNLRVAEIVPVIGL